MWPTSPRAHSPCGRSRAPAARSPSTTASSPPAWITKTCASSPPRIPKPSPPACRQHRLTFPLHRTRSPHTTAALHFLESRRPFPLLLDVRFRLQSGAVDGLLTSLVVTHSSRTPSCLSFIPTSCP